MVHSDWKPSKTDPGTYYRMVGDDIEVMHQEAIPASVHLDMVLKELL